MAINIDFKTAEWTNDLPVDIMLDVLPVYGCSIQVQDSKNYISSVSHEQNANIDSP